MLSSQSRPVIEATLPVVGEHIQTIAKRFYERLFTAHPSLLDGTFNRGNQHDGSQQQALAGSVAAFATGLLASNSAPEKLCRGLPTSTRHSGSSPSSTRSCTTS